MNRLTVVLAGAAVCLLSSAVASQQVDRDDPASPIRVKAIEIVALDDVDEQRLRKLLPIREGNFVRDSDFARTAKTIRAFDRGLAFNVKLDQVEGAADGAREATIRISGAGFGPAVYSQPPRLRTRVGPDYPDAAKRDHIQGTVTLDITVGVDGTVRDPVARSGPSALIESAIAAVKRWTFDPGLSNGEPSPSQTTVLVKFQLNDGTPDSAPTSSTTRKSGGYYR